MFVGGLEMAEAVETAAASVPEELSRAGPSSDALAAEADERREEELRKRNRDPPIVFSDIDGVQEFEKFSKALEGVELTPEERQSVDELQQYLVQGEGSWVLGDDFLTFIGRVLADAALGGARVAALRCLAAAARRDDVALLLHQDRRHHALLNYAHAIDAHPIPEQLALALFVSVRLYGVRRPAPAPTNGVVCHSCATCSRTCRRRSGCCTSASGTTTASHCPTSAPPPRYSQDTHWKKTTTYLLGKIYK
ncbi:hypothetical protein HF086_009817 [Spodoptera exigua]|uniref:Uncharacterized protein n=1 Tax=Spodoptera exigua TaxID=7107 RepID=A0A922SH73_SPOEX|nr:hypothetical protein HF086_009817 [Spodoptera exigua]